MTMRATMRPDGRARLPPGQYLRKRIRAMGGDEGDPSPGAWRLKVYGEEERMLEGPVVVRDNALRGTSAWANTLLGRDHNAKEQQT